MSWWRRVLRFPAPRRSGGEAAASAGFEPPNPRLERLRRLVRAPDPPADALTQALAALRGTPDERAAVALLLSARERLDEPVALRLAELCAERGEVGRAIDCLRPHPSLRAMLLRAELEGQRGDLQRALDLLSEILARDIDAPGARAAYDRVGRQLHPRSPVKDDAATLLGLERTPPGLRLVREANRGGSGTVYQAVDDALGRTVAFKIYHRVERDRALLVREVRVAAGLVGEGMIRIYDADPESGWLTMEWCDGGALRDGLRGSDPDWLVPIARWWLPLVRALERVHDAGWVHADVKPENILFRIDGDARVPVLSDFGIAGREGDRSGGGTSGFVSPERALDGRLAFDDDVFALGRVLERATDAVRHRSALEARRWGPVAARALGRRGQRPRDAMALLSLSRGA